LLLPLLKIKSLKHEHTFQAKKQRIMAYLRKIKAYRLLVIEAILALVNNVMGF